MIIITVGKAVAAKAAEVPQPAAPVAAPHVN